MGGECKATLFPAPAHHPAALHLRSPRVPPSSLTLAQPRAHAALLQPCTLPGPSGEDIVFQMSEQSHLHCLIELSFDKETTFSIGAQAAAAARAAALEHGAWEAREQLRAAQEQQQEEQQAAREAAKAALGRELEARGQLRAAQEECMQLQHECERAQGEWERAQREQERLQLECRGLQHQVRAGAGAPGMREGVFVHPCTCA